MPVSAQSVLQLKIRHERKKLTKLQRKCCVVDSNSFILKNNDKYNFKVEIIGYKIYALIILGSQKNLKKLSSPKKKTV